MQFNVGIIGATGYIGTPYRKEIRDAADDATIVALCARRRDRLRAAAAEDQADFFSDDWRDVVDHPDVNFVIVATPDAFHYEPVMACAAQRKHILCEKPIGVNSQQAYEMWTAYRDTGLGHFVPYWTRYVAVFRRAREIVAAGTLGNIQAVIYRWQNPRPTAIPFTWRDDASLSAAGSIADVGSHAYDTIRWIIGQEARRVLTHADVISPAKPDLGAIDLNEALDWGKAHEASDSPRTRQGTAYDYASIAWEFTNGAVGALILSHAPVLRKGLASELELHGTEASLGVDRINGRLSLARTGQDMEVENVPPSQFGSRFANFVFPAIRAQQTGNALEYPGLEDGWRVQIFTDAAALSAQRETWVELSELDAQQG